MLTIQSPKIAHRLPEQIRKSPRKRHQRAPSAQEMLTSEARSKGSADSPANFSESRRKKSQLSCQKGSVPAQQGRSRGTQEIMESIETLREEYKALKEAYRGLIQQRIQNTHEMQKIKTDNLHLERENQRLLRENERCRMQLSFLQQENQRIRRECFKMLEVEKFKAQKLEESLVEKEEYISQTLFKIRTEGDETLRCGDRFTAPTLEHEDSLTISQDKTALVFNNQSQVLSFSLTSVLQESISTARELSRSRLGQHSGAKCVVVPLRALQEQKKGRQLPSFRKIKKDLPKLQLSQLQSRTGKGSDKKSTKMKTSRSFREKQNRECLNATHGKKKSKKVGSGLLADS